MTPAETSRTSSEKGNLRTLAGRSGKLSALFRFLFWAAIMSADITTSAATGAASPAFPRHEQTFPTLTHQEIERMRRFGELRTFSDGEALFETGKPGPGMFLVLSGHIAITQRDGLGHVTPIIDHGPGQFLSEIGQLSGRVTLVDVHGEGDVVTILIPPVQ